MDKVRAGGAYIDAQGFRREGLVNALGAEVFGDQRLRNLVNCTVCGAMGDEGDDCGRRPFGHRLTTVTLRRADIGRTPTVMRGVLDGDLYLSEPVQTDRTEQP